MLSPGGVVPCSLGWAGRRPSASAERVTALVPLLLTGVRHHPPGRTDKNLCRCFGARRPGFSLIRRKLPGR